MFKYKEGINLYLHTEYHLKENIFFKKTKAIFHQHHSTLSQLKVQRKEPD
jgi:hypothetical protein